MQKKSRLFDDDDDDGCGGGPAVGGGGGGRSAEPVLRVNRAYAKAFEERNRKQELTRRKRWWSVWGIANVRYDE